LLHVPVLLPVCLDFFQINCERPNPVLAPLSFPRIGTGLTQEQAASASISLSIFQVSMGFGTAAHFTRDFFVHIDEFQSFTTLAVANMLSEMRKYRVGFTIAHQYLHQLEPDVRHAVLGNAGTIIAFRIGGEDAPYLARY